MSVLERLIEYGESNPNVEVEEWKKTGNKVLGYWCSYIPPEIIHAAGALPYRLRGMGATGTDKADHDMSPVCNCSFPRAVLDLAHRGKYDFLDGILGMNGCVVVYDRSKQSLHAPPITSGWRQISPSQPH